MKTEVLHQLRRMSEAFDIKYVKQQEFISLIDTMTSSYEDAAWVLTGGYLLDFNPVESPQLNDLLGDAIAYAGNLNGFWVVVVGDQPHLLDLENKTVEVLPSVTGGVGTVRNMAYGHGGFYATTVEGGLYRTTSLYQAWERVGTLPLTSVAADPSGVVIAAGDGVAQLSIDGSQWQSIALVAEGEVVSISMMESYWAMALPHEVVYSTDRGQSWQYSNFSQDAPNKLLAVDTDGRVLVPTSGQRACHYNPETDEWTTVILPSIAKHLAVGKKNLWIYLDEEGVVWRSVDGAKNWSRLHTVEGSYRLLAAGPTDWLLVGDRFQLSKH